MLPPSYSPPADAPDYERERQLHEAQERVDSDYLREVVLLGHEDGDPYWFDVDPDG